MTVRHMTRAEVEQAAGQAICYKEGPVCREHQREARAVLDALGITATATIIDGQLEQVGWWLDPAFYGSKFVTGTRTPRAAGQTVPVYRVVP